MKKYFITYDTIAISNRTWDTAEPFEFFQRLEELLNDSHVIQHSISFRTEVTKVVEPELVSYPPSKEEMEREREYQEFKGGRK